MGTQYAGADSFPVDFTVPAVNDTEGAMAFDVSLEALGDRTKSLHLSRVALADFAALRAIDTTSMTNGAVRMVKGQGFFTLDTASVATEVEPWIIDPTTGPGRWIGNVPHTTSRIILVQGGALKAITTAIIAGGSRSLDPASEPLQNTQVTWTHGNCQFLEVNTATNASKGYLFPISQYVPDGATLVSSRCRFVPNPTHGALPLLMPTFGVRRVTRTLTTPAALKSTNNGLADDPSATLGAYNAEHEWTWVADQNNVIDRSQFSYDILFFYEGFTNALANGGVTSFELTFSGQIPARGAV